PPTPAPKPLIAPFPPFKAAARHAPAPPIISHGSDFRFSAPRIFIQCQVGTDGEMEPQPDFSIIEIEPGELPNPVEAVEDRVAMDPEYRGGLLRSTSPGEEGAERLDQLRAVSPVIFDQRRERFIVERPQFRQFLRGEDQPVNPEIVEVAEPPRPMQAAAHRQCLLRLLR